MELSSGRDSAGDRWGRARRLCPHRSVVQDRIRHQLHEVRQRGHQDRSSSCLGEEFVDEGTHGVRVVGSLEHPVPEVWEVGGRGIRL
ncbi:hypothetical protein [Streptomyces sp. TS71-3]|uniref:hypothetical protein n=1 Tax=Streptomyces sp. TS71-3 TaxID=2733862 RepID=UPI002016E8B0|nr:hypothetical protein [Streptomyces sp. TS71-3]